MNSTGLQPGDGELFYEDIEQQGAVASPSTSSINLVALLGTGIAIAGMVAILAGYYELFAVCLLVWIVLMGLESLRISWRRRPGSQLLCPQCRHEIDPLRRQALLETRACPVCSYIFPSRLPPQMRKIVFDRASLPRVWLQGEVAAAQPAADDPSLAASAASEASNEQQNPYQTPAHVATWGRSSSATFGSALLLLLKVWWSALIEPLRTLLKTDEQLLAHPNLTAPREPQSERSLRLRAVYLSGARRQALVLVFLTNVLPLVAAIVAWLWLAPHGQEENPLFAWTGALAIVAFVHFLATVLGSILHIQFMQYGPRFYQQWLSGGERVIDAEVEPTTGYYGIRWRLINVEQQHELPRITFRFRQDAAGEVLLRLVNYDEACAWELPLPYTTPGQWQTVDVDLRAMIRQSAPDFCGDELHLTCTLTTANLELTDYGQIVRA